MRTWISIVGLMLFVVGCGQRPEPLMPDHLGSGAEVATASGPRALVAKLESATTDGAEGALVLLPNEQQIVVGVAIDGLGSGRYSLAESEAGSCDAGTPSVPLGEFDASEFGQGKFSLLKDTGESLGAFRGRSLLVLGPLSDASVSQPAPVVACGVLEVYAG
ncbi:MAG: hypothetical protein AAFQ99_10110 [Pseudomonadota bacterium]